MKFLEPTNFFVRTVAYDFINKRKEIQLKFRLVPMIHIGSKEYYQQVFNLLNECDEVIFEACYLSGSSLITGQYSDIAKKLGLVTQSKYLDLRKLKARLIHSDFTKQTGKEAWQRLRFTEKIKYLFISPLSFYVFKTIVTREVLAKSFMTSSTENYLAYGPVQDEEGTVENLIMNEREQIVFKTIKSKIESDQFKPKTIAIIYGASHMKSIARRLIDRYHYVPREGRFLRVFDIV